MEIRFAKPEDVSQILVLLRQIGTLHHKQRPDYFRKNAQKYGVSQILSMLDQCDSPIFVAAEGDRVLGYAFCAVREFPRDPVVESHTELRLEDLCVDEAVRRQGVGRALFDGVVRYAKMRDFHSVTLNVWDCNENAKKFYAAMGLLPRNICMELRLEKE